VRAEQLHLIHSPKYKNWVFDPTHPTQGRRYPNAHALLVDLAERDSIKLIEVLPRLATPAELERVHEKDYVAEVLDKHLSNEWAGEREDLAELASLFAGGTLTALELLLKGEATIAINFAGAKHHAQFNYSSGFCVFADFALAAEIASNDYGMRVAILDIDGHHGDGTENLTRDNPRVLTFSIHHYGIFPGTGEADEAEFSIYNQPLTQGDGDDKLLAGIDRFISIAQAFDPQIIFIACGADGHKEDPLTGLDYSVIGIANACGKVANAFKKLPILFGGAGGYLPDTRTPEVWANAVKQIGVSKFALSISRDLKGESNVHSDYRS
jgi:acetoin utilization protein AcuC